MFGTVLLLNAMEGLHGRSAVIGSPGTVNLLCRVYRIVHQFLESYIRQIVALAHVGHSTRVMIDGMVARLSHAPSQRGHMGMQPGLLHQTDVGIGKHSAEGTHRATVRTETAAVIVVPKDAFGNQTTPVGCHIRNATQLLYETSAKTLHKHYQHIRLLHPEQCVLDILGLLGIEIAEGLLTLFLSKIIESGGRFTGPREGGEEAQHRIYRGMIAEETVLLMITVTHTHTSEAQEGESREDKAYIAHECLPYGCIRNASGGQKHAGQDHP